MFSKNRGCRTWRLVVNEDIQERYFMVHVFLNIETYVRVPSDAGQKPQETQRHSFYDLLQIVVTILEIVVTLGQRLWH